MNPNVCIITASNAAQARCFEALIGARIAAGMYPGEISFRVFTDPQGRRIGSGGGTLWAIQSLIREIKPADPHEYFQRNRILIIHAGGESRRLPCYAPEGKVFAPLAAASSSLLPPVTLDAQLSTFFAFPWRDGDVIVASGDALLYFDSDALPEIDFDICGFASPATAELCSEHGVFRFGPLHERVVDYYQKQSVSFLEQNAALEGTKRCALDVGVVLMRPPFIESLLNLAKTRLRSGATAGELLERGEMAFEMYLELLTACLPQLTFDEYRGRVASTSKLPEEELTAIFDSLHYHDLGGVLLKGCTFHHMGSLREFAIESSRIEQTGLKPFYAYEEGEILCQSAPGQLVLNCVDTEVSSAPGGEVFVENCSSSSFVCEGNNIITSLSDVHPGFQIPEGMCLDGREVGSGDGRSTTLILVYAWDDTFKPQGSVSEITYCGSPFDQWLSERSLSVDDIWDVSDAKSPASFDLLQAKLFPENSDILEMPGYWNPPEDPVLWASRWKQRVRHSISQANATTDVAKRDEQRLEMRKAVLRRQILAGTGWRSVSKHDFLSTFSAADADALRDLYSSADEPLLRMYRRELLQALSPNVATEPAGFPETVRTASVPRIAVKEDQIVWARAPIRLDMAGGWTDTPPYTNREGGQAVNVAVDLNGQPPIHVFVRSTPEPHVRLHSIDLGVTETITTDEQILGYADPNSPFSLPKAALYMVGLAGSPGGFGHILQGALERHGRGIELTLLCAVPKGSGLGTSSVLGGALLGALHRFYGLEYSRDELFEQVLQMEQMLTTGGGWQDQIGGITGGVKLIETKPGLRMRPVIYQLDPFLLEDPSCISRMTLYYTGVTRLAKNILQEVVAGVNEKSPSYLFTHRCLKTLALRAQRALSLRDLDALARVVSESWEQNKRIHASTTNPEMEDLIASTKDHWTGMKLLGAGGGGFALFVSADADSAGSLRRLLNSRTDNPRARLVDFSLNKSGLVVTVS